MKSPYHTAYTVRAAALAALFVLLAFVAPPSLGAGEDIVRIDDFSKGLNTSQKPVKLQPGEAVIAHNIDLTKNPGGLTVRNGYDMAVQFPGSDSILTNGLITYTLRNGDRRLVVLTDSSGAPYGTAYISDPNTLEFNFTGFDGVDTTYVVPDTGRLRETARTIGAGTARWVLVYWTNSCTPYTGLGNFVLDTAATPSEIVDSMIAYWPSATAPCSSMEDYLTMEDAGDSIRIIEVTAGNGIYVYSGGGSFGSLLFAHWRVNSESTPVATRRVPLSGDIKHAQHNGDLYIFNGVSAGLVFDNDISRRFPVKAPGEIDAIPVTVPENGLGGTYRYAVRFVSGDASSGDTIISNQFSVLTGEIEACDGCGITLFGFPVPNIDNVLGGDTVTAQVWRTTALSRYIDKRDTMWYTGMSLSFDALTGYTSVEVTDTISDDSLRNSTAVIYADGLWYEMFPDTVADIGGPDTNSYTAYPKPGAPSIISWGKAASDSGLWGGLDSINDWTVSAGWSWFIVRYDTLLGIASDSGRSVSIFQDAAPIEWGGQWGLNDSGDSLRLAFSRDSLQKVSLALPRCEDSGMVYLLYRKVIKPLVFDSTLQTVSGYTITNWLTDSVRNGDGTWRYTRPWTKDFLRMFGQEFIALDARLIGQYKPGDTAVDSLTYPEFLTHTPYYRNVVAGRIKDVVSYDGVLVLADDQNVFTSTAYDTTLNFSALGQRPVGPEDGGMINSMWIDRDQLKVGKSNRIYNLVEVGNGVYRSSVAQTYGVVSPFSTVEAPEGEYLLSDVGVWLMTEGQYRERMNLTPKMDLSISSFRFAPSNKLSRVFGFYWDNKLFYTMGDTTFVLNKTEMAGGYSFGWTTWDVKFSAATRYRVGSNGNVPDTMYFAKPGGNGIYRLGAATRDYIGGSYEPVDWVWKSGALQPVGWDRWQPTEALFNIYSTDSTSANLVVDLYSASDIMQSAAQMAFGRVDTANVYRTEFGTTGESPYWAIHLYTINPIGKAPPPNTETSVEGIQLKLLRRGEI